MLHPTVFNTSEVCFSYGVRHAVISPGSRNAPLIISFARNDKIKKWIIPDERSAGFIALGIAQKLKQPVVLCCTSGTAVLNYAPAIAEAYYREIPLIVLSADRPPNLIDQRDGQTIRQFEALRNHVKRSVQLPMLSRANERTDEYTQNLFLALETALSQPKGPIHINIPFEEPFYPTDEQKLIFEEIASKPILEENVNSIFLTAEIFQNKKVLVLVGQMDFDLDLNSSLKKLETKIPIIRSPLNNLDLDGIDHCDLFLNDDEILQPDILITTGLSVLSKRLKNFLRNNKPEKHFHFDPSGVNVDTYFTQPDIIKSPLTAFLDLNNLAEIDSRYADEWKKLSVIVDNQISDFINYTQFSETNAYYEVLKSLPENIELHLGNSMPVRFADIFGVGSNVDSWCNRGTSGIDGCTSTAVGTSLVSDRLNVLLVGDISFLYDRNAFFHNHSFNNLRIIIFNNLGGGIFRLIDGPRELPELENYFETRHNRTAEYICLENQIEYTQVKNSEELIKGLKGFFNETEGPKLLEVFTDPQINDQVFKELKQHIHEQIKL